ncbi:hypothetical protein RUND412_002030 [Rhizina undulata]
MNHVEYLKVAEAMGMNLEWYLLVHGVSICPVPEALAPPQATANNTWSRRRIYSYGEDHRCTPMDWEFGPNIVISAPAASLLPSPPIYNNIELEHRGVPKAAHGSAGGASGKAPSPKEAFLGSFRIRWAALGLGGCEDGPGWDDVMIASGIQDEICTAMEWKLTVVILSPTSE